MGTRRPLIAGLGIITLLLSVRGAPPATAAGAADAASCPWLNTQLPVSARVGELLPAMTLDQKLDVLGLATPQNGWENTTTAVPELCIPAFIWQDGPAGITAGPAGSHTQLPAPIGLAAAWDPTLAGQYGAVLGNEAATKGIDVVQAPDLDEDRVPQWGRTFETLGEDPYLTSQMGVAIEHGIESQGVGSMGKHFTVYNQETNRNTTADDVIVSDRALHEIYLPAWEQSVANGDLSSTMCSYASPGGTFACQSSDLLNTILRDELGFNGFVRSDLGAVHDPVAALNAGTDQLKPAAPQALHQAVAAGEISSARLNQAAGDVLTQMFQLGVFDRQPAGNAGTNASTPANVALGLQAAEESTVLLKNEGALLPLGLGTSSIAVIGADAGSGAVTAGGGSGNVSSSAVVTPLQGIQNAAPAGTSVVFNDGSDLGQAAAAAQAAGVAIVFVDVPEGEGADLANLSLPGSQNQLIQAVSAVNPNTVVVLNSATPVLMPWLGQVSSVLDAWYPGQQDGNAIAAILFGDVNPSGKLPITFPASGSQTPVASPSQYPGTNGQVQYSEGLEVGYRWYDANDVTPLFPFGYGLSYTTFAFSNLSISPNSSTSLGSVQVSATVTNTGSRTGSDVAQLYVGDPGSVGEPPRQLKGFQKVTLDPGESTRVHFGLTGGDLSYFDSTAQTSAVAGGTYTVSVGDSSAQTGLPLSGAFQITGTTGTRHVTISAPDRAQVGTPFTVTATFSGGGDLTVHDVQLALSAPSSWQVSPAGPTTADTLSPSQGMTASWQVSVPAAAQDDVDQLMASALYQAPNGSRPGTSTARAQVSVDPVVTTTVTPPFIIVPAGQAVQVKLTNTNTSGSPIDLAWTAAPPAGSQITASPASAEETLDPGASSTTTLTFSSSSATPATVTVPINVNATVGAVTIPGPGAEVQATVPYQSLAAAFNNTGITDDADHNPGNYDGFGNSFSAEALAAVGITPGSAITSGGVTFVWPDVPAGQPDNVTTQGQTISLPGSGSTLGVLGSAVNGVQNGTGTIYYTDGSTQPFSVSFQDWITRTPVDGDNLVATTAYFNRTNAGPARTPSVFAAFVPLQAGKTVQDVVLPDNVNIHSFDLAIG